MPDLSAAAQAFAAVLPAELPDKTMIATVVLVARYDRPLPVWLGAATALALHVLLAVTAGRMLGLLPDGVVAVATTMLFAAGAVFLRRGAVSNGELDASTAAADGGIRRRPWAAYVGSLGVILLAEWGDITQLATASIAAKTGSAVGVALGATAALWIVAALAVTLGRGLAKRLPIHLLQQIAAGVLAVLAVTTLWGAF